MCNFLLCGQALFFFESGLAFVGGGSSVDMNDLILALKNETKLFKNHDIQLTPIGDGNINKVYRAVKDDGKTYVIKQAQKAANISEDIKLNLSRGQLESDYLSAIEKVVPGMVPHLFYYSKKHRYMIMQDMGPSYKVLQKEMAAGRKPGFLAEQLGGYIADTCAAFSDFLLDAEKKKAMQKHFTNPKLCGLTERLVFTEPYIDCKNNTFAPESEKYIREEIYGDKKLKTEAAKLKYRFMNCPQALIHGDLHFGSVFAGEEDIVVFDPEFCFFGPIGYDLGNAYAHFILQYIYAETVLGSSGEHLNRLKSSAAELINVFKTEFLARTAGCRDPLFGTEEYREEFLASVIRDACGYAAAECIRRTVGLAKVSAFSFPDEKAKSAYELRVLKTAKSILMDDTVPENNFYAR